MTDAVGREVHLAAPATRIVTNESLLLISLALIDPDPIAKIAGWAAPRRIDRGMYETFRKRFPDIDAIPEVGGVVPSAVSVESILSANPDLFVVSLWQPGWESATQTLEAAGVPVIFLDGPENDERGPAEATAFSIKLLGQAIGRETQAVEFAFFVEERYRSVAERLEGVTERPDVIIDAHAGTSCCATPGSDNRITQYMELAGGHSIGADSVPGYDGQLSAEYVLGVDPQVYIATGISRPGTQGGLVVGGGIDEKTSHDSLRRVVSSNFLGELTAVSEGRTFGVSHQLSISALSVLVLECFAKWMHPDLFSDLDPADTLAEINRRFMALPLEGTFWVGLSDAPTQP
ncbi:ABC transporter substrate-binding protein [Mesorhizobium sp. SB112]|uniref:ABC transporter substrate-binding protein n=1 Tax=Mesorhizobium sp. SB112 TaxID=3151853 RepID=UPI003264E777